jgi:hypothetical protein
MHFKLALLAVILSTVAPAFGQPVQTEARSFRFMNADTEVSYHELVMVMRQVAGAVPKQPVDSASHAVTVTGSADQLAAADWIVKELDGIKGEHQGVGARRAPQRRQFTTARGEVVDILYLDPAAKSSEMHEIITTLRQIADVNHVFNYSSRKAIVFQAPRGQALLAEWLISTLEKPLPAATPSGAEQSALKDRYRMQDSRGDIAGVFHWNSALTPLEVQELEDRIRTETGVMKMFTYFRTNALAVRGTEAQLAKVSALVGASPAAR